jgi:hypothetical protein
LYSQEEAMRGYVGYLGPLSLDAVAETLDFAPGAIEAPGTAGEKLRVVAATKVCKQQ